MADIQDPVLPPARPILPSLREVEPLILEYMELFNQRYFYDCHEVAEDLWIEVDDDPDPTRPDRDFLRGLIHAATAFHHLFRRNPKGFEIRCKSALTLLEGRPDVCHGIPIVPLRDSLQSYLHELHGLSAQALPPYRDERVPYLHPPRE
jgi:predicted metal-dependent hydrolase